MIIIPEGRNYNGWRGFGLELRWVINLRPKKHLNHSIFLVKGNRWVNSFSTRASGSGRSTGKGSTKEKEIILDKIPINKEHSKPISNLNKLTINMGSGECGQNKGDSGMVHLSLSYICFVGRMGNGVLQMSQLWRVHPR